MKIIEKINHDLKIEVPQSLADQKFKYYHKKVTLTKHVIGSILLKILSLTSITACCFRAQREVVKRLV